MDTVSERIEMQKIRQRTVLFTFLLVAAIAGILLLAFITVSQCVTRSANPALNLLGSVVLLPIFGILMTVTKSLWPNKNRDDDNLPRG